jgi:hypothetical protein
MASMISADGVEITKEHVGRRAIYTDRAGKEWLGTLTDVLDVAGMVNIDRDNSSRLRYYVPCDTIKLVPLDDA